jgi:hypothetical protein
MCGSPGRWQPGSGKEQSSLRPAGTTAGLVIHLAARAARPSLGLPGHPLNRSSTGSLAWCHPGNRPSSAFGGTMQIAGRALCRWRVDPGHWARPSRKLLRNRKSCGVSQLWSYSYSIEFSNSIAGWEAICFTCQATFKQVINNTESATRKRAVAARHRAGLARFSATTRPGHSAQVQRRRHHPAPTSRGSWKTVRAASSTERPTAWLQFLSSIEEAEAGTGTVQLAEVSLSLSTALGARRPLPSRTRGVTAESPG